MKRKMMMRFAPLGFVALLAAACFPLDDGTSKNELYLRVRNESESVYDYADFLKTMFNGGKDTVSVFPTVNYGPIYHYSKSSDDESASGGFAFCIGLDTLLAADRTPSFYAVCDKGGNEGSLCYVVYHDTIPALMPDHAIEVYIPNDLSYCQPVSVFVQNTHAVTEAVLFGVGLADGPFRAGDFLSVTFKSFKKDAPVGEKTVRLVDGTKLLEKWTEVDLMDLGSMDTMDIILTSSRPDMPLYVCLDDFYYHYLEAY